MTLSCRIVRRDHKSILGLAQGRNFALFFIFLMENKTLLEITASCFLGACWDSLFHIVFLSSTGFILKGCNFSVKGGCCIALRSCPCLLIASVAICLPAKGDSHLLPTCNGTDLKNPLWFVAYTVGRPQLLHCACNQNITCWGWEEKQGVCLNRGQRYLSFLRKEMAAWDVWDMWVWDSGCMGGWKSNFQHGSQSRGWEHWSMGCLLYTTHKALA